MSLSAPAPAADTSELLIGTRIDGRYWIERLLARGGMSMVYVALHEQQQREVAIKVLDEAIASDPEAIERFLHEARTASSLSHGHVVGVSDFGRLPDGRPYLVMPLIAGTDTATLLAQEGPQPPLRVAALLAGVGSALDAMHEKGFVHRDIKSENLMHIRGEDGTETVLVLDFGIAAVRERGAMAEDASGTPEFMAPEVLAGQSCDHRSDVYSLATVAFELITGSLPFDGEGLPELLANKTTRAARTLSEAAGASFPGELENVLARALARDPERRQSSAGQFVRELQGAAASLSSSPVKAGARKPRLLRSRTLVGTGNRRAGESSLPASLRTHRSTNPGYRSEPFADEAERTGTHRRESPQPRATAPAESGAKAAAVASAKLAAAASAKRASAQATAAAAAGAKQASAKPAGQTNPVRLPPPVVVPPPRVWPVEPALGAGDEPEPVTAQHGATPAPHGAQDLAPEPDRPPSGVFQLGEDSLQPPPDLDADAHELHAHAPGLHWLAYPTIAALIGAAVMVFNQTRPAPTPADPGPAVGAHVRPEPAAAVSGAAPALRGGAASDEPPSTAPAAAAAPPSVAPATAAAAAPSAAPALEAESVKAAMPQPDASPQPVAPSAIESTRLVQARVPRAPAAKARKPKATPAAPARRAAPKAKSAESATEEPGRAAALTQQATDAMLRGDFQAADAAYQQAIAVDPRHAPALRGRGLLLERMERPKEAASAFRQFLRINPDGPGADKIRARLSALE